MIWICIRIEVRRICCIFFSYVSGDPKGNTCRNIKIWKNLKKNCNCFRTFWKICKRTYWWGSTHHKPPFFVWSAPPPDPGNFGSLFYNLHGGSRGELISSFWIRFKLLFNLKKSKKVLQQKFRKNLSLTENNSKICKTVYAINWSRTLRIFWNKTMPSFGGKGISLSRTGSAKS